MSTVDFSSRMNLEEEIPAVLQGSLRCPICQEDVVLPVHFTCFSCIDSCSDDYCVCFGCAQRYLEFHLPRSQRSLNRKCLLCPMVVHRDTLNESHCFRKNRVYMRLDAKEYECPSAHTGCLFRGKQMTLERHLLEECLYRTLSCLCGESIRADQVVEHRRKCWHYKSCPQCQESILIDKYSNHLRSVHGLVPCPHTGCIEVVEENMLQHHLSHVCQHRLLECTVCRQYPVLCKMGEHLSQHLQESRDQVSSSVERLVNAQRKMAVVVEAWTTFCHSTEGSF